MISGIIMILLMKGGGQTSGDQEWVCVFFNTPLYTALGTVK